MRALRIGYRNEQSATILEELEATTRAVVEADQAYVQQAIGSAQWERRGLLQRLARADRRPAEAVALSTELAAG
jgi:hypothetical protein